MNFNLYTIPSLKSFFDNTENNDKEITNFYWLRNKLLTEKLDEYYKLKDKKKILDVGGAFDRFPYSTHILDIKEDIENNIFKVDLDFDKFPFENNEFEFTYCRHTIEDIQNPTHCLNEIFRTSKEGYIETPSPLAEYTENIDFCENYKGYIHHRYIVWSSLKNNTLHILPKYPIIETLWMAPQFKEKLNYLLNNYPLYWNNYYLWNDSDKKPDIVLYRHGVNMDVTINYVELINKAINESIEYTGNLVNNILNYTD
jgi:hypothetical protein